ncbi:MAG: c-type cytochrome [Betaproteobacteria bacterium]|nr:c-type cytochrome [Betaproteobacteria bacterium]
MKLIVTAAALALAFTAGTASASQALAQKYSCLSCHQVDKKVVGPALADVSKKYKGNAKAEATIAGVIKNGSKGAWGAVPMPPSPQVPDADAAAIAKWVMSL